MDCKSCCFCPQLFTIWLLDSAGTWIAKQINRWMNDLPKHKACWTNNKTTTMHKTEEHRDKSHTCWNANFTRQKDVLMAAEENCGDTTVETPAESWHLQTTKWACGIALRFVHNRILKMRLYNGACPENQILKLVTEDDSAESRNKSEHQDSARSVLAARQLSV